MCILFTGLANTSNTALAEEPVYIPDPNLKAAIEKKLGISDPNAADMLALTELEAVNCSIIDLTGLEYATNIHTLYLLALRNNLWVKR